MSAFAAVAKRRGWGETLARPVIIVLAALTILQLGNARPAAGEQAYAHTRTEAAQELTARALECLHRGEDATAKDAKLAAYREGLQWAERAVAADDASADAHYARFANQGRILMLEGAINPLNLLTVNRELDRVLELNPNHADALAARGGMYRQLPWVLGGSLEKAADYLSRAVTLDPDNACGARIELAETYRDMGHPERSVPLLEQAVQVAQRMGKQRQLLEAQTLLAQLKPAAH